MDKMKPLYTLVENESHYKHEFLKILKVDLPQDPTISILGIYLMDSKLTHHRHPCTSVLVAALPTRAELWTQSSVQVQRNQEGKCGVYTQWELSARKNAIMQLAWKWIQEGMVTL